MSPGSVPITALVLSLNEAANIGRCLRSLSFASEVIVVDSYSTDDTLALARSYGARVIQHEYSSHPAQWQWILDNVKTANAWIFAVDADFAVSAELWRLIEDCLRRHAEERQSKQGYYVRHLQVFGGRQLRFGTMYPRYWLRVFDRRAVVVDPDDKVDVHFVIPGGNVGYLEADVVEDNVRDRNLTLWIGKQVKFARRQSQEELMRRAQPFGSQPTYAMPGTPDYRTWRSKQMWFRLPLYLRPFLLFAYRYVVRLGFLDGQPGLLYHFTQALLYRLAVDVYLQRERRSSRA